MGKQIWKRKWNMKSKLVLYQLPLALKALPLRGIYRDRKGEYAELGKKWKLLSYLGFQRFRDITLNAG